MKVKVLNTQTQVEIREMSLDDSIDRSGECFFGRSPNSSLVLDSPDVSRLHGKFVLENGDYYFYDLGSSNGSLVNGKMTQPNQGYLLKSGDIIRVGEFVLILQAVDEQSEELSATVIGNPNATVVGWQFDTPHPSFADLRSTAEADQEQVVEPLVDTNDADTNDVDTNDIEQAAVAVDEEIAQAEAIAQEQEEMVEPFPQVIPAEEQIASEAIALDEQSIPEEQIASEEQSISDADISDFDSETFDALNLNQEESEELELEEAEAELREPEIEEFDSEESELESELEESELEESDLEESEAESEQESEEELKSEAELEEAEAEEELEPESELESELEESEPEGSEPELEESEEEPESEAEAEAELEEPELEEPELEEAEESETEEESEPQSKLEEPELEEAELEESEEESEPESELESEPESELEEPELEESEPEEQPQLETIADETEAQSVASELAETSPVESLVETSFAENEPQLNLPTLEPEVAEAIDQITDEPIAASSLDSEPDLIQPDEPIEPELIEPEMAVSSDEAEEPIEEEFSPTSDATSIQSAELEPSIAAIDPDPQLIESEIEPDTVSEVELLSEPAAIQSDESIETETESDQIPGFAPVLDSTMVLSTELDESIDELSNEQTDEAVSESLDEPENEFSDKLLEAVAPADEAAIEVEETIAPEPEIVEEATFIQPSDLIESGEPLEASMAETSVDSESSLLETALEPVENEDKDDEDKDDETVVSVASVEVAEPVQFVEETEEIGEEISEEPGEEISEEIGSDITSSNFDDEIPDVIEEVPAPFTEKYIALLAHDSQKSELIEFVSRHQAFLSRCLTIATPSISATLSQQVGFDVSQQTPAIPPGGYQAINSLITSDKILAVIFLRDFFAAQTTQANDEAFSRSCNIHQVLFASNPLTAEAIVHYIQSTVVRAN